MEFRIADSFTDALAKLPAQEQKAVKTTAFDLQLDPSAPGLQFHRIDKSKDRNFWSLRVSRDIRIIVHKAAASLLLAYVDHHDQAYAWAERRRIEAHPKTGAIQIVEVRERVDIILPDSLLRPSEPRPSAGPVRHTDLCFKGLTSDQLLSVGVPTDWVSDVLGADEDRFLAIAAHLPAEASEALLEYVSTGVLAAPIPLHPQSTPVLADAQLRSPAIGIAKDLSLAELEAQRDALAAELRALRADAALQPGFAHPDALRRFRTVESTEELRQALDSPWDKWMVFLHPSQRETIEADFSGPARVAGSAGTGKTVVALHRALRLARAKPNDRVLLTTFSRPLANALERKLGLLVGEEKSVVPRVTVAAFHGIAEELHQLAFGHRPHIASEGLMRAVIAKAAETPDAAKFPMRFLRSEWANVVDAWQLDSEEAYAGVPRLGRKNRMGTKQRSGLWPIFQAVREALAAKGVSTWPQVLGELSTHYAGKAEKPFTHVVVDEAQDLGVAELRFLAAIAQKGMNSLFFAGDLGQRIFQQPFSWLTLGVDVRGRSQLLKVNYRTSHQIREAADRILPKALRDVDGLEERRAGTVSVFNGPEPSILRCETVEEEIAAIGKWIAQAAGHGIAPSEIGVFVREHEQLDRARAAVKAAGASALVLSERPEEAGDRISVGTMHLAKGLEFKVVAVMACDEDVLPLQDRVESIADEAELDDVYETERQLLYVACTRARDRLLVSGVRPCSEFLDDFSNMAAPPVTGSF